MNTTKKLASSGFYKLVNCISSVQNYNVFGNVYVTVGGVGIIP